MREKQTLAKVCIVSEASPVLLSKNYVSNLICIKEKWGKPY